METAPTEPGPVRAWPQEIGGRRETAGAARIRSALEAVGLVIAPATLLIALLYYFGWARSNALWLYFGIDPSTLGFSVQDYLLRAVGAVFVPLGAMLIFGLLVIECHREVARWIKLRRHPGLLRLLAGLVALVGLILFGAGIAGESGHPPFGVGTLFTPLAFALGVGAMTYGAYLRRTLREGGGATGKSGQEPDRLATPKAILVGAVITLSMFWALGDWAAAAGRGRAVELAQHLAQEQPGVIIYSKERLQIQAPGVRTEEFAEADSTYRFRYRGLTLLIHSGGKYFLVPSGWSPSNGVAIVLPDSNDRRVEFTPPEP